MRYLIGLLAALFLTLSARAEIIDIDSAGLQDLIDSGVPLIDVRTPGEWRETGVIEGSHLLTFFDERGRYDAAAWLAELERIAGPDQPVALICATGGRTTAISFFLDQQVGYDKVYHATEGVIGWLKQDRAVASVAESEADCATC
jgi:rhodanese-related sulfurtransferase